MTSQSLNYQNNASISRECNDSTSAMDYYVNDIGNALLYSLDTFVKFYDKISLSKRLAKVME